MKLLIATAVAVATFTPSVFAQNLISADELEKEVAVLEFLGVTNRGDARLGAREERADLGVGAQQMNVDYRDGHGDGYGRSGRHRPPPPGHYRPSPPGYHRPPPPHYHPPHHRPPGGYPGRPAYPPPGYGYYEYTCYAQNARGMVFRATDDTPRRAQRQAMDKCYSISRFCDPAGCERGY